MTAMSRLKKFSKTSSVHSAGFTLLEVIIAMTIMVIAFSAILAIEADSIRASARAKQMNMIAMLARNLMVKTELLIEGKAFREVRPKDEGQFEAPYEDYRWRTEVKEIQFPNFAAMMPASGASSSNSSQSAGMSLIFGKAQDFFSKAVRRVLVTVVWMNGKKEQTFSLSTFWVDLSYELQIP